MEKLARKAKSGDAQALENLIKAIQDPVYTMALRMVGHPEDARDEAQEILTKVIIHIGGFRSESRFMTWVYRIAANHLINARKRRAESLELSFDSFEAQIATDDHPSGRFRSQHPEEKLLVEEMKHICAAGTLLCLSREVRLAFILSDAFGVSGDEGAFILGITPTAFRKRASRGRAQIQSFMMKHCSQVRSRNPCQCERQIPYDIEAGYINPNHLLYADNASGRRAGRETFKDGLDELGRISALLADYPSHPTPDTFVTAVKALIQK